MNRQVKQNVTPSVAMNAPILLKVPLLVAHIVSLRVAMTAPTPNAKSTSTERKKYTDEHKTFELPMPYSWGPPTFRVSALHL